MTASDWGPRRALCLLALALSAAAGLSCSDRPQGAATGRPADRSSGRPSVANVPELGLCPGGERDLLDAAYRGDHARANRCLQGGVSPNAVDGTGASALDLATARNHPEIVRLLLENRATIVQTNERNPLGVAARDGREAVVDLLLAAGADPGALWQGKPPLMHAIDRRKEKIALDLLDAGANAFDRDDAGRNPLVAAVDVGSIRLVDALLARGADPTDPCPGGSALDRARARRDRASIFARLRAALDGPPYPEGKEPGVEGDEPEDYGEPEVPADDDPYAKEPPPDLPWPPPSGLRP